MRIEIVPLIVGALLGLIGLGLIFDAWTPDEIIVKRERRRRPRIERNRGGEAAIGFGVLCMAAAFIGRDTWRYSVDRGDRRRRRHAVWRGSQCALPGAHDLRPRRAAPPSGRAHATMHRVTSATSERSV